LFCLGVKSFVMNLSGLDGWGNVAVAGDAALSGLFDGECGLTVCVRVLRERWMLGNNFFGVEVPFPATLAIAFLGRLWLLLAWVCLSSSRNVVMLELASIVK
jgi:hypothetical protein